jgi:hypothetical protein
MANNRVVNDVNTHIEWKDCTTGKYPCDPKREKEDAWGRQFTSYPEIVHAPDITGEWSYGDLKMNPGGIGLMPAGTVIRTTDGVTKV